LGSGTLSSSYPSAWLAISAFWPGQDKGRP
jgi:hypothetical protein